MTVFNNLMMMGLTPARVETIFRVLTEINGQETQILLAGQNASKALEIAHRAYVLEMGSIVHTGTGKELLSSPDVRLPRDVTGTAL